MNSRDVIEVLRRLERVNAAPGFTEKVMYESKRGRKEEGRSRSWAIAALVILSLGIGATVGLDRRTDRARTEALLAEQAAIEAELQRLRDASSAFDPVIELGNEDGVRYLLELDPEERQPQFASMDITY